MPSVLDLAPAAASVPTARRFVLDLLEQWGEHDLADTAVLLTSELVTNSVLHARTGITVVVERLDDGVAISVSDGSSVGPRVRRHSADATTGRGLDLLDRLAASWQVLSTDRGKTIRFVLAGGADPWAAFTGADWTDAEL